MPVFHLPFSLRPLVAENGSKLTARPLVFCQPSSCISRCYDKMTKYIQTFKSILFITRAPQESPSQKMQPFSSPKGGSWSQAFHAWTKETGDESSPYVSAGFCDESLGKNFTLMSHTKMSIVFGRGRSTSYSALKPAK